MSEPFATMLRRHRLAAALTQERLAERAGISATGIAALEAGRRRTPRLSTVSLLVEALDLDANERAEMVAAAVSPLLADDTEFVEGNRRFAFVGRPRELARLHAALAQRTRVALVFGEAGVGKTRLAGEFASAAAVRGDAAVLWGRCTPDQLGAYEPFVDPIRTAVRLRGDGSVAGQGELVRLVPELANASQGGVLPSRADSGVERRLLFEAAVEVLADLGPTILVLDDLQWADSASLALLAYLASAPKLSELMMLGTVRSTGLTAATAAALADLRRRTTVDRITLEGLAIDDLATLVTLVAGREAPPGLVQAVAEATDGNPFFVEELTEHLLNSGYSGADGAVPRGVPEGVRDTLAHRLAGLSPDAQMLLRCGAVLGRVFDSHLAASLAGLVAPGLIAAIEDSLLSGLVTEQSVRSMSFSHALVRTTVYESMSAVRRVEIHRQAALRLEQAQPTSSADINDLVRHWSEVSAVDPTASPSAARWAVRAGDAAAAAAAIDEAIECYQKAVSLWTGSTGDHADTLIRLGVALSSSGRRAEADECFRAALHLADGIADAVLYARAAIGLAATVRYGHSDPQRIAALEGAVERLGPDEFVLRPAALVTLKRQLGFDRSADAYRKRRLAAELVMEAVSRPDISTDSLIAIGSLRDSIPVDDPQPLRLLSRQIIDIATSRRDLPVLANAWYGYAWAALELNDADQWHEAVAGYTDVANQLRLPHELALAATMAATTEQLTGLYCEADASARQALSHATAGGDDNGQAVYLANSVVCGLDLGQAATMLELMQAVQADYVRVPTFMAGLTLTAAVAGDHGLANDLLDRQGAAGFEDVRRDAEWLPVIGFLSHACAIAENARQATTLHALLAASPARGLRIGPVAAWWGPIDHHLGALSRVLGRLDEAEARLENALVVEHDMHARPFQVRTQVELADVLEAKNDRRDADRIVQLRSESAAIATELGAPGLIPVRATRRTGSARSSAHL